MRTHIRVLSMIDNSGRVHHTIYKKQGYALDYSLITGRLEQNFNNSQITAISNTQNYHEIYLSVLHSPNRLGGVNETIRTESKISF